ncbi:MAG: hypothetical protein ACOYON_02825 [Fimbriimonas sp.]
MEQLKRSLLAASVAALVTVVALPMTRWPVLNHVDLLTGGWVINNQAGWNLPTPKRMIEEVKTPFKGDSKLVVDRLTKLAQEQPSDVNLISHALRWGCISSFPTPPPPNSPAPPPTLDSTRKEWNERWRKLIPIARLGARIEPDNGYFPLMEACGLYRIGDKAGARRAYLVASQCKDFDDHAADESERTIRASIQQFGYRGEIVASNHLAGLMFPHFSNMIGVTKAISNSPDDLVARVAAVRLGQRLVEKSPTTIGVMVGRRIISIGLLPVRTSIATEEDTDAQWQTWGHDLAARATRAQVPGAADVVKMDQANSSYSSVARNWQFIWDNEISQIYTTSTFAGAIVLAALVLFPLGALAACRQRENKERLWSPNLLWLLLPFCFLFDASLQFYLVPALLPLLFLGIERLGVGYAQVTRWLGGLIAIGLIVNAPLSIGFIFLGLAYLVALVMERRKPKSSPNQAVSFAAVLVWGLFAGFAIAYPALYHADWTATLTIALASLGLLTWVAPAAGTPPVRLIGALLPVFTLLYVGTVLWEIRTNEAIRAQTKGWLTEAPRLREKVGLRPGPSSEIFLPGWQ